LAMSYILLLKLTLKWYAMKSYKVDYAFIKISIK